jgi:UDP-N-acetylglucosamine 2-epimerase (non-hydrolysing)
MNVQSTIAVPSVIFLVGTKAQFIKTAPILLEMDRRGLQYKLVYTGQHSETFTDLELCFGTRSADVTIVGGNEAVTAFGLAGWAVRFMFASFVRSARGEWRGFRWAVVHGDTASTLLSALVMKISGVAVVHVEAGLRSPRLMSPFPEEIVRRLVSRMTSMHLAPNKQAAANLAGLKGRVVDTEGNTLQDCLGLALDRLSSSEVMHCSARSYALVSLHRSENLANSDRLDRILSSILRIAEIIELRFVLHPVTRKRLKSTGWWERLEQAPSLVMMDRTDYVGFVKLMLGARFLMTDGGSNQEEAAMLGLPTLLLRTETERDDGLCDGSVELSGLNADLMVDFATRHAESSWVPRAVRGPSPSARVVEALMGQPTERRYS